MCYACMVTAAYLVFAALFSGAIAAIAVQSRFENGPGWFGGWITAAIFVVVSAAIIFFVACFVIERAGRANERIDGSGNDRVALGKKAVAGLIAGSVTHDSNNFLGTLRVGIDVLERSFDDAERRDATIARMKNALNELARLNKWICRCNSHAGVDQRSQVPLQGLLQQVITAIEHDDALRGQTLRLESLGNPDLNVDEMLVRQAVFELVADVAKKTDRDGTIVIRAGGCDGAVYIEVCEAGSGFSQDRGEDSPRTPSVTTQEEFDDGLLVAKSIATVLGGNLRVEDAANGGSGFRLTFPVGDGEAAHSSS